MRRLTPSAAGWDLISEAAPTVISTIITSLTGRRGCWPSLLLLSQLVSAQTHLPFFLLLHLLFFLLCFLLPLLPFLPLFLLFLHLFLLVLFLLLLCPLPSPPPSLPDLLLFLFCRSLPLRSPPLHPTLKHLCPSPAPIRAAKREDSSN